MKLIIPMAGRGTRVRPHSHTVPKPLLPVAGTMIIERLVETFIRTLDRKIEEIVYILGPDFGQDIKDQLSAMSDRHDAKATFRVQFPALGTAHAVACASDDLEGEVIVAFADTLFDSKETFNIEGADSVIWLKRVEDPSRFGVAVHEGETITGFVEKPQEFISDLAIIGVYYFKDGEELKRQVNRVIDEDIKGPGGEYFLTEALDNMINEGKVFKIATVDEWLDCGTLPAWLETTGEIVAKENQQVDESKYPGSTIISPVFIADGVQIENCTIGPKVSIETDTTIKNSKIDNTIIRDHASLEGVETSGSTIGAHTSVRNVTGKIDIGDHSSVEIG
ncbi:MAG: glucose-1-phosphate thymidylyltransferase [Balneolaceae bacterium]|nr:glucose-1-phosphate thymidylyltransferase [Balneolaceae bacterium]MBO6545713.1 glucose-1-phosphate thymidylyltransferase [Balneolaceae bacterium]MBO6647109.1 glucose-1-phosphate thymidylyltransferase [Balneolaceae bacterium]